MRFLVLPFRRIPWGPDASSVLRRLSERKGMTPTKLLIGQARIVFAIVIGGVWATTQWTAAMLGYQPRLGEPWFVLLQWPVYYPWRLFEWWYAYEPYAPNLFQREGLLAGASGQIA